MAPHSSTLGWKIPQTEEPGRLQSMRSLRVGHDWATWLSLFTFMHWGRKWQPTPVFLPGESQGQWRLVSCCLWGRRVGHDWSDLEAAAVKILRLHWWLSSKESTYKCRCEVNPWVRKIPLKKEMSSYSSILAWKIPGTEESGGLHPWGCKRVKHNLVTKQQWQHGEET